MNIQDSDDLIKYRLKLKDIDKKICQQELQFVRCCLGMKGKDNCEEFLELIAFCYKNKGRKVGFS